MVALLSCPIQKACNEVKKGSDWAGSCSEASQQYIKVGNLLLVVVSSAQTPCSCTKAGREEVPDILGQLI